MKNKLPDGATKVHLYNSTDVLRPRGTMKKESLGMTVLERLESVFEDWTDPEYGDNPEVPMLEQVLFDNMMDEVITAWLKFKKKKGLEYTPYEKMALGAVQHVI